MQRSDRSEVFEKTCNDYLEQVGMLDVKSIEQKLGVRMEGTEFIIPLFGRPQRLSGKGIIGPSGEKPPFEICVLLCNYLLQCPDGFPEDERWVSYRDFKDSGPLTSYFENEVEKAISQRYTGRLEDLREACKMLESHTPPDLGLSYDLSIRLDLFPRIPILLLYNDADNEFPAKCSVLFERRAEIYLDTECLAIAGRLLFTLLKENEEILSG